MPGRPVPMPISKRPFVSTDSECASHAVIHARPHGRRVNPGTHSQVGDRCCDGERRARCRLPLRHVGHQDRRVTAVGLTRSWSRQVGRSVVIGVTIPNRNGLVSRIDVPVMVMTPPSGPARAELSTPPRRGRVGSDKHGSIQVRRSYEGHQATKTHLGRP